MRRPDPKTQPTSCADINLDTQPPPFYSLPISKKVPISKRLDAPRTIFSMRIAMRDLELGSLQVLYPGDRHFPLGNGIESVPLKSILRKAPK